MTIKIEGLDEVLMQLEELDVERLEKAVGKACALVERTAKEGTPKGTGALRRSIKSRVETDANGNVLGIIFTPLEYAPYVEFGTGKFAENGNGRKDVPWHYKDDEGKWHTTSGMKPHPYLRPALYQNENAIKNLIKVALTND